MEMIRTRYPYAVPDPYTRSREDRCTEESLRKEGNARDYTFVLKSLKDVLSLRSWMNSLSHQTLLASLQQIPAQRETQVAFIIIPFTQASTLALWISALLKRDMQKGAVMQGL